MPQINNGKSPPWVAGEIVTAAELNGMIDSATINPSVITDQPNFTTLTGDEYALIVDPVSGNLKKTELKNSLLTGEDIKTDSITQVTGSSAILTIQSNPSVSMLLRGNGGLGLQTETGAIIMNTIASGGTGSVNVESNGMTFDGQGSSATGVIDFQTRTIFSYTGAIKLPVGTTAQRPATPVAGDTRFNSTLGTQETYNGSDWSSTIQKVAVLTREQTYGQFFTLTNYAWTSIPYNTINQSANFVVNSASFTGVLSSTGTGIITLPAGTYVIEAEATVQASIGSGSIVTRVYDNTALSVIKVGTATTANYGSNCMSIVYAVFTLTTQSDISIQYYAAQAAGNPNLASPAGYYTIATPVGTQEVIFTSKITKLA